jgi:uncharacterized protein
MLLIRSYVAQSEIDGLGVFAGEFAPRGSLIWSLNPKFDIFVNETDICTLPAHMRSFIAIYSYPHLDMPGYRVVDVDNGRFMNHSLTPNTDFHIFDKGYALADIAPGDEITCNYYEFDPDFTGFMPGFTAVAAEVPLHTLGP